MKLLKKNKLLYIYKKILPKSPRKKNKYCKEGDGGGWVDRSGNVIFARGTI